MRRNQGYVQPSRQFHTKDYLKMYRQNVIADVKHVNRLTLTLSTFFSGSLGLINKNNVGLSTEETTSLYVLI